MGNSGQTPPTSPEDADQGDSLNADVRDTVRRLGARLKEAVKDAQSDDSSISDPAWEEIIASTTQFLQDLVSESHRFRRDSDSSLMTDGHVKSARANIVPKRKRKRAHAATAFGGIACGGGLAGIISILTTNPTGQKPNALMYLLLVLLTVVGTALTAWGARND